MAADSRQFDAFDPAVEFYLLGRVDFDDCLALQRRLRCEIGARDDGRIDVLLCEHLPTITVGRSGSRGHIRFSGEQLQRRGIPVRWTSRSGGAVLHAPGQLAVYPVAPIRWHGWTVGEYVRRLQQALIAALADLQIPAHPQTGSHSIWGRSGQLAAVGVAVRDWIATFGFYLNVNPRMTEFGFVDSVPAAASSAGKTTMGCLLAERRRPVKMTQVRTAVIANLAAALDCRRYHLHTGHPLLCKIITPNKSIVA